MFSGCGFSRVRKGMIMYQIDFQHPVSVYFCGIGGISMSGLAEILASRGFTVSGSDRAASPITEDLSSHGIRVLIGQKAENITPDLDLVVFTAAIHPDNPEFQKAQELGIPHLTRAELLGEIMRNYGCPVAIAGTHGKTTTTSMISEILLDAEDDPTISVGGILKSIHGNVRVGRSDYFIAEACEYTNSFLSLYPKIGVILDVDADHLDFFKDLNDIRHSFRKFAELIPADGTLVINSDIENVSELTYGLKCYVVTYGSDRAKSEYYPVNIRYDGYAHPTYTCCHRTAAGGHTQLIHLQVPGEHNVYNSIAAIAVADLLGVDREHIGEALSSFEGTDRRFEYKGEVNGVTIIDDYAHHPTEITATLTAAAHLPHDRIFCIFQPHTYTRTKALLNEFAAALSKSDVVILADIYAARETDTLGISSQTLADKIREGGHKEVYYFPDFEEIENFIRKKCRKGDLVITMGAGNVTEIGPALLSQNK